MRGASPRKAQKTTAAKMKDLGKLGTYLSGKGAGSADAAESRSKVRATKLVDAARTAKGGGQSRVAPKGPSKSTARKFVDYGVKKMTPEQRRKSFVGTNPNPSTPYTGTWNVSAKGGRKPGK